MKDKLFIICFGSHIMPKEDVIDKVVGKKLGIGPGGGFQ